MSTITVQDPVCGMRFPIREARSTVQRDGQAFHFCCEGCRKAFEVEPDRYARRDDTEKPAGSGRSA